MLCALLFPNLLIRTISNMRFGPHDWHLVEMPHFAWIWISLQSSFMVPLPIFAEFSNPNIHLYIVPVKGIGKAPIITKLPSLSANWTKTCPKSSSGKIPHFKRRPLPILAASSATGHFFSTRLARETVQQPKPPLLPSFTCPGTVNPDIKQNISIITFFVFKTTWLAKIRFSFQHLIHQFAENHHHPRPPSFSFVWYNNLQNKDIRISNLGPWPSSAFGDNAEIIYKSRHSQLVQQNKCSPLHCSRKKYWKGSYNPQVPSLSANRMKTCPKCSLGQIPHFKRHPLQTLAAISAPGHFLSTLLAREMVLQTNSPFVPFFTCPWTLNSGGKKWNGKMIAFMAHWNFKVK